MSARLARYYETALIQERTALVDMSLTGLLLSAFCAAYCMHFAEAAKVWSRGCVFRGSPHFIETNVATTDSCARLCENKPPCGYFSRAPRRNGTCTGMSGRARLRDADPTVIPGTTCGVLTSMAIEGSGSKCSSIPRPPAAEQRRMKWTTGGTYAFAASCDFSGRNIRVNDTFSSTCGFLCLKEPACSHFAVKQRKCFLKRGQLTWSDAVKGDGFCAIMNRVLPCADSKDPASTKKAASNPPPNPDSGRPKGPVSNPKQIPNPARPNGTSPSAVPKAEEGKKTISTWAIIGVVLGVLIALAAAVGAVAACRQPRAKSGVPVPSTPWFSTSSRER